MASWTFVIKSCLVMNKIGENINLNLCNVQVWTLKFLNIKVYMESRFCIYENFDLIFNSNINVKYNKFLYIHLKKLWWMQNVNR